MKKIYLCFLLVVLSSVAASQAAAAIRYNITDLGTLPGYESSRAWSINNKGQIVGEAFNSNYPHNNRAVLFDSTGDGNNIDLGTLGGENSAAVSINNNMQIVGFADSQVPENNQYATIFQTDSPNNIGLAANGGAYSINDNRQIVGFIENTIAGSSTDTYIATLFDESGTGNINLRTLSGYAGSIAHSINNNGTVVGYSSPNNEFFYYKIRATLFDDTGIGNSIDMGTLGGTYSAATCINDNGQIVGFGAISEEGLYHAAIFDQTGSGNNVDLGTIPGYDNSGAFCINNRGQIVGQTLNDMDNPGFCAVLFDPTGGHNNVNLNDMINPTLGWTLVCATCINDNGWIVGWGINPNGDRCAFLLKPIPAGSADFQRDGTVDLEDYAVLAAAWRSTPADDNWNPFCDISDPNDDLIDERDLAVFAENYLMQSP